MRLFTKFTSMSTKRTNATTASTLSRASDLVYSNVFTWQGFARRLVLVWICGLETAIDTSSHPLESLELLLSLVGGFPCVCEIAGLLVSVCVDAFGIFYKH